MCCGYGRLVTMSPLIFHYYDPNATFPLVVASRLIGWLKCCTFCNRTHYVLKA